jgi:hypothetical protein
MPYVRGKQSQAKPPGSATNGNTERQVPMYLGLCRRKPSE